MQGLLTIPAKLGMSLFGMAGTCQDDTTKMMLQNKQHTWTLLSYASTSTGMAKLYVQLLTLLLNGQFNMG